MFFQSQTTSQGRKSCDSFPLKRQKPDNVSCCAGYDSQVRIASVQYVQPAGGHGSYTFQEGNQRRILLLVHLVDKKLGFLELRSVSGTPPILSDLAVSQCRKLELQLQLVKRLILLTHLSISERDGEYK
jgi:hypothetical protein